MTRNTPGQSVVTSPTGQQQLITAVHDHTSAAEMRDLTIATIHTYYVLAGDTPVLVHNCGDYVDLYHGTNSTGAGNIRMNGVDPGYAPRPRDFGDGFYTTRDQAQAAAWAQRRYGDDGTVLHFRVSASDIASLNGRTFGAGSPDLSDFLRMNRTGAGTHAFEMVEGPMLLNPRAFIGGAAARLGGNQIAFFGDRAAAILNGALQ